MRPSSILRALPALPPRNAWTAKFPRQAYALVSLLNSRVTPNRVTLATSDLCERFVREIKLQPDEVVLEAYSGPGVLTRALLSANPRRIVAVEPGPELITHPQGLAIEPKALEELEQASLVAKSDKFGKGIKGKGKQGTEMEELDQLEAAEAAEDGMDDMEDEHDDDVDFGLPSSRRSHTTQPSIEDEEPSTPLEPARLLDSSHDPKLSVLPLSPYDWDSWASLLLNPLFSGEHAIVHKREWQDDISQLRFVAQIPDSVVGEQLISQWIACIPRRNWLFSYGRMRMDLLVSPSLFDRMIAQPDSKANCKLSITTAALCDVSLLPPYHLDSSQTTKIPNRLVRKDYRATMMDQPHPPKRTRTPRAAKEAADTPLPYPFEHRDPTPTVTFDFHPQRTSTTSVPLERPSLVGISITPKIESVINPVNKDCWDYVLRNLFVSNSKALKVGITFLGPGASNLLKVIANPPKEWHATPVAESRLPRSFSVDEWATVVRAFEEWAFQPENLTLVEASAADEQHMRAIGGGM